MQFIHDTCSLVVVMARSLAITSWCHSLHNDELEWLKLSKDYWSQEKYTTKMYKHQIVIRVFMAMQVLDRIERCAMVRQMQGLLLTTFNLFCRRFCELT